MLLQRLRDHRAMDDGVGWSAQADFAAQLADWEHDFDPAWPLQRAERAALVDLNVPHFVMASDGHRSAMRTAPRSRMGRHQASIGRAPVCAVSTKRKSHGRRNSSDRHSHAQANWTCLNSRHQAQPACRPQAGCRQRSLRRGS